MSPPLPGLRPPASAPRKIAQRIADRLRERIAAGELAVGDHLPPEAELVEELGVSRASLREALRLLEAESLIRSSQGSRSGPVITAPGTHRLAESASMILALRKATVGDVHSARMFLEPGVVRELAGSGTADAVADDLDRCVDAIATAVDGGDLAGAGVAVEAFHRVMIVRSGNVTLQLLLSILEGVLDETMILSMLGGGARNAVTLEAKLREIAHDYRRAAALIRARQVDAAHEFWRDYMERSRRFLCANGMDRAPIRYRSPTSDEHGAPGAIAVDRSFSGSFKTGVLQEVDYG